MKTGEELFRVEDELQERLRIKYRRFNTNIVELKLNSNKIHLQLTIADEYLKVSDEQLKEKFNELCNVFQKTCFRYQVPFRSSDILVLTDDEIDRGLQIKLKNQKDGSLWSIIFIPPVDLNGPYTFWNYTFLHELGHCWIDMKYKDLVTEEIFVDLVAIIVLKELIPPQEKLFKETVKYRSYIGGEQGMKYFGEDMQKNAIKDPESHLKKMLKLLTERE